MAISKILHMKDCGDHFHARHLKRTLDYVTNPDKTQGGRLMGAINCTVSNAFEQMKATKRLFNKTDKRQGYHLIISFVQNEVDADTAFEITGKFVNEYLKDKYEAVYVVHDNTSHIHSHIVFNSVSFLDGKKFRYEKGDWEKIIQPITNRLCEMYGLSTIDINSGKDKEKQDLEINDNPFVKKFDWSNMIKRDLDACILQADDFEMFEELLKGKGYEIKYGKHYAIKPPGMQKFRRTYRLGKEYEEERIRERVLSEDISYYKKMQDEAQKEAEIVSVYVKRYKRANLTGIQKKYYQKLYRTGQLIKRPYSMVWKYKADIRNMNRLQEEYLFLVNHDIKSVEELKGVVDMLADKKKEFNLEKSRIYKEKNRYKKLFEIADSIRDLSDAEKSYRNGDSYFIDEHLEFKALEKRLLDEGYSFDEVIALKDYYKGAVKEIGGNAASVSKELKIGYKILDDIESGEKLLPDTYLDIDFDLENEIKKENEQPKR